VNWITHVHNRQSLTSLFGEGVTFPTVLVHEIRIELAYSALYLRFDVAAIPSPLPKRWHESTNTTQITISAWSLHELSMSGWRSMTMAALSVVPENGKLGLRLEAPEAHLRVSVGALQVEKVSGYIDGQLIADSAA
jgi:hypothetical protein